ncbi:hypothetical protein CBL_20362 [Carabus blaptoides fortunei]
MLGESNPAKQAKKHDSSECNFTENQEKCANATKTTQHRATSALILRYLPAAILNVPRDQRERMQKSFADSQHASSTSKWSFPTQALNYTLDAQHCLKDTNTKMPEQSTRIATANVQNYQRNRPLIENLLRQDNTMKIIGYISYQRRRDPDSHGGVPILIQRRIFIMNIDERVAEILEDYPVIWDRRCKMFKDVQRKENVFVEIATRLNSSADIVKARYKAIREKYRKEKIKIDQCTRSGAGQMDFEPWHLMKTLKFLDMVQTTRMTISNIKKVTPYNTVTHCATEEVFLQDITGEIFAEEDLQCTPQSVCESPEGFPHISDSQTDIFCISLSGKKQEVQDISNLTPTHPKRKRNDKIETMVNRLANAAERISEKRTSEYDTFGLYVGQCLNKMPEDVANETIEKMNKVLYEAKKKIY